MEVLEYPQKFEVEPSTFPDSTNTEKQRKLVFSLQVCVSVCLCENVCQWISYYERVDRFGWILRCMLQLATNREPPLTSTIGSLFPPNLGRGVIFFNSLNPYISKTIKDIEKQRPCRRKIWRSTNFILYIFSIFPTVFEIFWKNCSWKNFVRG